MSNEIAVPHDAAGAVAVDSFEASLAAEREAERALMRSIVRSVVIGVPLGIAFFVGLIALAVGDQLEWWTILGLGSALGLVGAALFGMLGGVTVAAHVFEDVDRGVGGHADPH
jgi:type IV secretory pathway TrbD component